MDSAHSDGSASPREMEDGEILMLCDRRFPFDFERDGLAVAGRQVRVRETPNSGEGTAHSVWDGAVILGKYLEHCFGATALRGACVAELGAGTGLAGCCAAALGAAPVVLTDLPYALPALRFAAEEVLRWDEEDDTSVALGAGPAAAAPVQGSSPTPAAAAAAACADGAKGAMRQPCVAVCVADWTEPSEAAEAILRAAGGTSPDVILLADVVWVEELVEPLIAALERLAGAEGSTSGCAVHPRCEGLSDATCCGPLVVAAHQTRSQATDDVFWAGLSRRFEWRRVVDVGPVPAEFSPVGPLFLVEARLRIAP